MAELTQLSDLYPLMMPRLPGIDTYTLDQALQEASREFCAKSEIFREKLTPIDLEEDENIYSITPAYDCHVKRILNVWMRSEDDVTYERDGTLIDPSLYKFELPDQLTLDSSIVPGDDIDDGLVVEIVMVPYHTQSGTDVLSDEFLNEWYEAIMWKAYHDLMMMPKKRWTDYDMAGYFLNKYNDKMTDAMAEANLEHKTQLNGFTA